MPDSPLSCPSVLHSSAPELLIEQTQGWSTWICRGGAAPAPTFQAPCAPLSQCSNPDEKHTCYHLLHFPP